MADCCIYTFLLAAVGLLAIFLFLLENLWSLLQAVRAILAPYFIPNEETALAKKFGPWALVTGSTDGIGRAYSFELAKRGINIVLVSRNEERLKNTAKEIESRFSVKTKIIAADFSLGRKAVEVVKEEIGKLEIDILVNNVGKMYEYPTFVTEVPEQVIEDIININVGAATLMCRSFLEGMKQRRRGAIVNVSSGSEHQPMPFIAIYAATKAYIKSFSAALRYEYQPYGITVQHLMPMYVDTKMNAYSEKMAKDKIFVVSPEQYAKYAVATLGKMDESSGHWAHGIQTFLLKLAPTWIRIYIAGNINLAFRKEYLSRIKPGSKSCEEAAKIQ
ncbi:inactive hydroxysteroid dehydrogenase-like protein 1 [Anoplophora glabripennis]|uniref:inactive hydroxysteroid dehydrogenase-like protein 1 n=1 Tax=Anoplophora glabripennis TaxID=217634 RepID=UPI000874B476|nr:inactive hydroxysteroid dehydrogenase-like protein 1 [Anoplophora glabripennis]XP_018562624.1 inactive hydroxysteroid dehydrogenase-like protein 1 [Anoplophora glabripennis]XP_018562625.1 inactive hydroxysteroid dehydrogenase-like protein 1 [Anoplophora glabripennis]